MPARVSEADVKRLGRAARKQVARQPAPVVALGLAWRQERRYSTRLHGDCYFRGIRLKPEEIVQFDVMNLLRREARDGIIAFHIANEAKRSRFAWTMQAAMGFLNGVPDIAILGGTRRIAFVECKAGQPKLSPAQETFHRWCEMHDIPIVVVTDAYEMRTVGIRWSLWR